MSLGVTHQLTLLILVDRSPPASCLHRSTTLLTTEQLQVLGYREHIHLLPDGCFSLGCLNAAKIEQLARAIDNVIRHPPPLEEDDLAAQAALQIEMALRQGFGPDAGF